MLKKIILTILILNIPIFAKKFYYIKLGSFRHWSVLEKSINRLPPDMRSHVVVVESNGWLIPYAYYTSKLYALKRKIYSYKRYFPDAIISSSPQIVHKRVFRDYRERLNRYRPIPKVDRTIRVRAIKEYNSSPLPIYSPNTTPKTFLQSPTNILNGEQGYEKSESVLSKVRDLYKKERKNNIKTFDKKMLSGRNFYLAYKSPNGNNDLLIKLSFGSFKVKYQPIIGNMDMKEAKYIIDNDRLYMFADTFSENGAYSKIEMLTKDYMVVSSWFGNKKINTLRYYYSLDKAKEYLGKDNSNKLVNALEDRDFDKIEQAFIGVDGVYIRSDDEDW